MRAGTSLNPYAESYVPISKRGARDGNKEARFSPKEFKSGNEAVWLAPGVAAVQNQQKTLQNADHYKLMGSQVSGYYGSSSHSPSRGMGKQVLDEESDMDLAYLQMTFPGISDDSLSDVYLANRCDLEAAIEMLNQLEHYSGDFSEKLPDSLDIGDVSESGFSGDGSSQKLKTVTGDTVGVASPSGLSESAPGS